MNYKKLFVLSLSLLTLVGCGNTVQPSTDSSTTEPSINNSTSGSETPETSIPTDKAEVYTLEVKGTGSKTSINLESFNEAHGFKLESFDHVYYDDRAAGYVKMGSHDNFGVLKFSTTEPTKIKNLSIVCKQYMSSKSPKLEVKLSNGETKTQDITSDKNGTYNFSFTGEENISSFEISSMVPEQRVYLKSISFTAGEFEQDKPVTPSNSETKPDTPVDPGDIANPSNDSYQGSYYSTIDENLTGNDLVKALSKLIRPHTNVGYGGLYGVYETSDVRPGTNQIWDMYSNCKFTIGKETCGNYSVEGDCYNREHTIPQSWFNRDGTMRADAHHVIPTDGKVNGVRSNYPHGEVVGEASYTSTNGSKLGTDVHGDTVFEPIDEYKGDFARMYFYMLTCYNTSIGSWTSESKAVFSTSYPYLTTNYFELYTKWALEDPVSQKEIDRNNAVYAKQKNRNPYIDHPSYFYRAFVK